VGKDGKVSGSQPFLTGFLDGQTTLGRPVDVQPLRDGSLLVSDDDNGVIYRMTMA
jgi:glucose/arabinose dehydrogenase